MMKVAFDESGRKRRSPYKQILTPKERTPSWREFLLPTLSKQESATKRGAKIQGREREPMIMPEKVVSICLRWS